MWSYGGKNTILIISSKWNETVRDKVDIDLSEYTEWGKEMCDFEKTVKSTSIKLHKKASKVDHSL